MHARVNPTGTVAAYAAVRADDQQAELLSLWSKRSLFHAGNRVFHQGARADRFWLIRERATPVSAREGRYRPAEPTPP